MLQDVYVEGLPPAPQVELNIDREKASAFGVTFEEINNTISTNLGSTYINDFPNRGRMQRVVVQARPASRMQADEILSYNVRNTRGQLVPLSSFATVNWAVGPAQIVGFNYYPSVRISGSAKPGYTSRRRDQRDGAARAATAARLRLRMDRPVAAGEAIGLAGAAAAGAVRAAGVPGARRAVRELDHPARGAADRAARHSRRGDRRDGLRGLPNDVYFTVALVTIIGLAAKDGILIIEFAKSLREQGKTLKDATLEACHLRFRPILMTGLAFCFGVAPMVIASGASAKSQQALGSVVMGGMIAVVILALIMVPVFFVR